MSLKCKPASESGMTTIPWPSAREGHCARRLRGSPTPRYFRVVGPHNLIGSRLMNCKLFLFFFLTLVTGLRRSLSLELSDTRVYSVSFLYDPASERRMIHSAQW